MYHATMTGASALEREIREQPMVLAQRRELTAESTAQSASILSDPNVSHVVIVARGSSDNAARYAQYLFGQALNLAVYRGAPSLFRSGEGPSLRGAAILGISQSGQSPDIVNVLRAARQQGRPTFAITSEPSSPLGQVADVVVPLLAGVERSVAATKTYTSTLHSLVQICAHLVGDEVEHGLDAIPDLMGRCIDMAFAASKTFLDLASDPASKDLSLTVIGRGTGSSTASESALKIREVAGIRAESYSAPNLLHGPIAANRLGTSAWILSA
jgi:glucosamine--fructose-6-phosphate aminotransferase (isomerizing)